MHEDKNFKGSDLSETSGQFLILCYGNQDQFCTTQYLQFITTELQEKMLSVKSLSH